VLSIGASDPEERNQQFEFIKAERKRYELLGSPILSVDTKKKEFLGGLYRAGSLYSYQGQALKRYDHDFPYLADGKVIPHGIYDLQNNSGFVTLGTSVETAQFIGASLKCWWNYRGRYDYPRTDRVFLLFDNGGANAGRSHQFKLEMLKLAAQTGLIWQIAHYPSYCSKWNPIEHRFFPHVTRALQGIYLDSVETVRTCIEKKATTTTGLTTRAYVLNQTFKLKQKTLEIVPEGYPFVSNDFLPKYNYSCHPSEGYMNLTYLN
jgi:hypothetical protein